LNLRSPVRCSLSGKHLEVLYVAGGSGLLAALSTAYPHQAGPALLEAYMIRNVLATVPRADQPWIRADLHRDLDAPPLPTRTAFAERGEDLAECRLSAPGLDNLPIR
jgi:transposase-like protein